MDATSPALCPLLPLLFVPFQIVLSIYQEVKQSFRGGKRAGCIPRFKFLFGTKFNVFGGDVVGFAFGTRMGG